MKRWSSWWSEATTGHVDGRSAKAELGAAKDTSDEPGPRRFRLSDSQLQLLRYLGLLFAIGIVLMLFNSRPPSDALDDAARRVPAPQATIGLSGGAGPAADYARALEQQLEDALRQLHGVAAVHVSVTLAAGAEQVLAEQVTTERRLSEGAGGEQIVTDLRTSTQPVLVRSDQARQEQPIVLMERAPIVQGVLVVTDAATDSRMRYEITRSVMTLLDLPAHRVYVLPQRW